MRCSSVCWLGRVVPFLTLARQDVRHLRLAYRVTGRTSPEKLFLKWTELFGRKQTDVFGPFLVLTYGFFRFAPRNETPTHQVVTGLLS